MTVAVDRGLSLDELLIAIAQGDQNAFGLLYQRTSAHLLGMVLRLHEGDRVAAENALEEIYVEVWRRSTEFDPADQQALVWLMSLARQRALGLRMHQMPAPAEIPANPEQACAALLMRACRDQMQMTDTDTQYSLALAYYQGMSRQEIAAQLGRPLEAVKAGLRRALHLLQSRSNH